MYMMEILKNIEKKVRYKKYESYQGYYKTGF